MVIIRSQVQILTIWPSTKGTTSSCGAGAPLCAFHSSERIKAGSCYKPQRSAWRANLVKRKSSSNLARAELHTSPSAIILISCHPRHQYRPKICRITFTLSEFASIMRLPSPLFAPTPSQLCRFFLGIISALHTSLWYPHVDVTYLHGCIVIPAPKVRPRGYR